MRFRTCWYHCTISCLLPLCYDAGWVGSVSGEGILRAIPLSAYLAITTLKSEYELHNNISLKPNYSFFCELFSQCKISIHIYTNFIFVRLNHFILKELSQNLEPTLPVICFIFVINNNINFSHNIFRIVD